MEKFKLKKNGETLKVFTVSDKTGILNTVDKYLKTHSCDIKRRSYDDSYYCIGWYDYSLGNKYVLEIT